MAQYIEERLSVVKERLKNINIPLIVTATDTETKALHEEMTCLDNTAGLIQFINDDYSYYLGFLGNYVICHIQCEMGAQSRGGSLHSITSSINLLSPKFVLMIGIAFGINEEKQNIGDVLISESIIPYDSKRVGANFEIHRGKQAHANKKLLNRFKNIRAWKYLLPNEKEANKYFTDLLCGETLVDNKEYRDELHLKFPTSDGGEMEGAGVFAACDNKVPWIIVKSICDFADGNKKDGKEEKQDIAIKSAINLCMQLFCSEIAFEDLQIYSSKKKIIEINYLNYQDARKIVQDYKIRKHKPLLTEQDWKRYCISSKKEDGVPKNPDIVYQNIGWTGWNDWLKKDNKYRDFNEAKEFVNSLGLKDKWSWKIYCERGKPNCPKKPDDIPDDPAQRYWKEWVSWSDWLRNEDKWLPFEEAREFVRDLGLQGQIEWKDYCQGKLKGFEEKPVNIPSAPDSVYEENWTTISNWLGYNGKIKPRKEHFLEDNWWPFDEAKQFVKKLKLKNSGEWNQYCRGELQGLPLRPKRIPRQPSLTYNNYGDFWKNWNDWLGVD